MTDDEAPAGRRDASGRRPEQVSAESADLYRIAYEQSVRALDDQLDELSGVRGRASAYMAFVGSATAFLVGTGLKATHRDGWFYLLALAASVASLFALYELGQLLRPVKEWSLRMSATIIIEKWIESEVPGPTVVDLVRALALRQDEARVTNDLVLGKVRKRYLKVVVSGGLGIVLWSALVWARA